VGAAGGLESSHRTRTETARVDALEKIRPKSWNLSKKACNLPRAWPFERTKRDRFCWVKALQKPAFKPLSPPQAHPLRGCKPEANYPSRHPTSASECEEQLFTRAVIAPRPLA